MGKRLNNVFSAMGTSRLEHAANIEFSSNMWQDFNELHANAFKEAGRKPLQLRNADGVVVASGTSIDDLMTNSAAKELLTNANGTVRHEDFMVIRDQIVEVRRRVLVGIADLEGAGLTFTASITDQLVGFENINEFGEAQQEMNPNSGSMDGNDTVFTESYVPNPITHSSFQVPWRQNGFDYKRSLGMSESVRQVSEKLDNTLFNGNSDIAVNFGGSIQSIYGYTTHPDRGTGTIVDWTVGANNDQIVKDVITQVGEMWANQGGVMNDSVVLYVSNDFWTVLSNDYKAGFPSDTHIDRIKAIPAIRDVKPSDKLAAKSAVLVEMERRTIELAKASDIIALPHMKTNPMAPQTFTTYAAMVHQIKSDSNGQTGIRHLTI